MADRIQEIREYCTEYCRRHSPAANGSSIVPIMFRMDYGRIVFGYYAVPYNANRAVSVLLRKASVHDSETDVLRVLEDRRTTGLLESNRVIADHIACWEGVEEPPPSTRETLLQLEAEARYFRREQTGTRNLKPRIEQDIRSYNVIHYGDRALVPMIFELGRAGIVFGFFNDCTENRGNAGYIMLTHASTFQDRDEIWQTISRGYNSKRRACIVLDQVTQYYSMMDMHELADNAKAKELIARIPAKPKPKAAEPVEGEAPPPEEKEQEQEQDFLKLWGWQIPVAKDSLPGVLTQEVKMTGIAGGIGKALKTDISTPARKILQTEIRIPFRAKKE